MTGADDRALAARTRHEAPLIEDFGTFGGLTLRSMTGPNLRLITTRTLGEVSGSV